MIAEAQIETERAAEYVMALCEQFEQRAAAQPDLGVRVERGEKGGTVDFGWGRCALRADAATLMLRAEAADRAGLQQVQELIRRHLEKHGEAEGLTVSWRGEVGSDAESGTDRRDAMRGFHRRMRHERRH